jgi:hypothetical protein
MSLLPWILLAFHRLIQRPTLLYCVAAAASYAALLATHNGVAVLFTPFLFAFVGFELWLRWRHDAHAEELAVESRVRTAFPLAILSTPPLQSFVLSGVWSLRQWLATSGALARRAVLVGISLGFGVLLTTAVWLPSLSEQASIRMEQWALPTYLYADHFVYPQQLVSPAWGFGYSVPGPEDGMSFQLGLVALALATLGTVGVLSGRIRFEGREGEADSKARVAFFALALLVIVALMLPGAVFVWNLVARVATLVQFPWRLLAVASVPLALLAATAAPWLRLPRERFPLGLAAAITLVIAASAPYLQPQYTPPNPRDETQQTWRDYERKHPDMVAMVAQTREQPTGSSMLAALEANETPQRFEAMTPGIAIEQLYVGGGSARARVSAGQPGTIRYLSYWFPGWYATLDDQPLPILLDDSEYGLMAVEVPAGEHQLYFRFGDPPLRQTANNVTLLSLILLVGLLAVGGYRELGKRDRPPEAGA